MHYCLAGGFSSSIAASTNTIIVACQRALMIRQMSNYRSHNRGGYRGGRGSGRGGRGSNRNTNCDNYASAQQWDNGQRQQYRLAPHPCHLRGRAVGMHYAKFSRQRQRAREAVQAPELLQLADSTMLRLQQLLDVAMDASDSNFPIAERPDSDSSTTRRSRDLSLKRDAQLDAELLADFLSRQSAIMPDRKLLPVWLAKQRLLAAVEQCQQVLVLSGPTGCGKSTQMPQLLLDSAIAAGAGSLARIVVTQPRRLAATALAERVAEERGEPLGHSVGYQVRLDRVLPNRQAGSIVYCTVGVLLRWLESDPTLATVSHLVVDEVHERSADTDLLLAELKRTILPSRPDLKLLLMSATMDAEQLCNYFGPNSCRVSVEGRLFPVRVNSLEDCLRLLLSDNNLPAFDVTSISKKNRQSMHNRLRSDLVGGRDAKSRLAQRERDQRSSANKAARQHGLTPEAANLLAAIGCEEPPIELVAHFIGWLHRTQPPGSVLVFVPGMRQIKDLMTLLSSDPACSTSCHLLPLHSRLPSSAQRLVFLPPPIGKRKIVLATNIAETSITIDDVVYVIDTGFAKLSGYHHLAMSDSLAASSISRDNARQREGRAGRVQAGFCYRLYSRFAESRMPDRLPPEVLRLRLEDFLLQVKLLHPDIPVAEFLAGMPDPPPAAHVLQARQLLLELGALTIDEDLTPLGRHVARLPLPCQLAKMVLLGACFSCLDPVLTIAAALSHRSPFEQPLGAEADVQQCKIRLANDCQSDHLLLWLAYDACWRGLADGRSRSKNASRDTFDKKFATRNYLSPAVLQTIAELKAQLAEQLAEYMTTEDVSDGMSDQQSTVRMSDQQSTVRMSDQQSTVRMSDQQSVRMSDQSSRKSKQASMPPTASAIRLTADHPSLNRNSHRLELIRAVVTAGLYPNIVRCKSRSQATGRPGEPPYELPIGSVVNPASLFGRRGRENNGELAWLAYFDKCLLDDRRKVSLFDATLTRPLHLLFCCSEARHCNEYGAELAVLDNWIKLAATPEVFSTVMALRQWLDHLLANLIEQPGLCMRIWSSDASGDAALDASLLNAIADLLADDRQEGCYFQ